PLVLRHAPGGGRGAHGVGPRGVLPEDRDGVEDDLDPALRREVLDRRAAGLLQQLARRTLEVLVDLQDRRLDTRLGHDDRTVALPAYRRQVLGRRLRAALLGGVPPAGRDRGHRDDRHRHRGDDAPYLLSSLLRLTLSPDALAHRGIARGLAHQPFSFISGTLSAPVRSPMSTPAARPAGSPAIAASSGTSRSSRSSGSSSAPSAAYGSRSGASPRAESSAKRPGANHATQAASTKRPRSWRIFHR